MMKVLRTGLARRSDENAKDLEPSSAINAHLRVVILVPLKSK